MQNIRLVARLTEYRAQIQQGFRHISRLDEMDLIQEAIAALSVPSTTAAIERLQTYALHVNGSEFGGLISRDDVLRILGDADIARNIERNAISPPAGDHH